MLTRAQAFRIFWSAYCSTADSHPDKRQVPGTPRKENMKYLAILTIGAVAAACSSNQPAPAASAASVDAASNTPAANPSFAPVASDGTAPAATDAHAAVHNAKAPDASPDSNPTSPRDAKSAANSTASNVAAMPAAPPSAPDNSRVNARDSDGKSLTPMDQGGSEGDRKITQQIRQAVMKDSSLSFTAKNVKIITVNGKVTLRGPVKTEAERSAIEAAARNAAGGGQVESLLEVKN